MKNKSKVVKLLLMVMCIFFVGCTDCDHEDLEKFFEGKLYVTWDSQPNLPSMAIYFTSDRNVSLDSYEIINNKSFATLNVGSYYIYSGYEREVIGFQIKSNSSTYIKIDGPRSHTITYEKK